MSPEKKTRLLAFTLRILMLLALVFVTFSLGAMLGKHLNIPTISHPSSSKAGWFLDT